MYVGKTPNSKYYQIVYFIDGKRKTKSTKTTNKKEAQKILANFNHETPQIIEVKPNYIQLDSIIGANRAWREQVGVDNPNIQNNTAFAESFENYFYNLLEILLLSVYPFRKNRQLLFHL